MLLQGFSASPSPEIRTWAAHGAGFAADAPHPGPLSSATPGPEAPSIVPIRLVRHLRAVAEGREAPRCTALDGLRTLQATLAVLEAARTGAPVVLQPLAP